MKVSNILMRINNTSLRILNKSTGNLRVIDVMAASKDLLRNYGSQCDYGELEGQ